MMYDVAIKLQHRPGALAEMGEALERAKISIEGGGVFAGGAEGHAHFLFQDGHAARTALERAGIEVLDCREVLVQRLAQDQPGQLGQIARLMAQAGVNIETMYSDHKNQLILVVDDPATGTEVSRRWSEGPSPD